MDLSRRSCESRNPEIIATGKIGPTVPLLDSRFRGNDGICNTIHFTQRRWLPASTMMVSPVTCSAPSSSHTTGSATASVVPAVPNGADAA